MRYLCGQGRVVNGEEVDGERSEFVAGANASVGGAPFCCGESSRADWLLFKGVVFVLEGEIWRLIKSFTEIGVTLSTNVNEGRRRTVVGRSAIGWDECSSGRGMLEAESMSFCTNYQNLSGVPGII